MEELRFNLSGRGRDGVSRRLSALGALVALILVSVLGAPAMADDAPTRRLETVGVLGLPPTLEYKAWRARLYADEYLLVGSRADQDAYLQVVLSATPEAVEILERHRRRSSMGLAIFVSGTGLFALSRYFADSQVGAQLGGAAALGGIGLMVMAPRTSKACDIYNDWASAQGIPRWP